MQNGAYETVARSVLVRDIQTPIAMILDGETPIGEAVERLAEAARAGSYDFPDRIVLISQKGRPYAWSESFELVDAMDSGAKLSDGQDIEINAAQVVSDGTTAVRALDILAETDWVHLFVLRENLITGTVCRGDFAKPPFRILLFSLCLTLEEAALGVLLPHAPRAWNALSSGRQLKARDVYEKRHSPIEQYQDCPYGFLGCTTFIDKGTMLAKLNLLPSWTRKSLESLIRDAEEVRNACAHPMSEDPERTRGVHQLSRFIHDARRMIHDLESVAK